MEIEEDNNNAHLEQMNAIIEKIRTLSEQVLTLSKSKVIILIILNRIRLKLIQ